MKRFLSLMLALALTLFASLAFCEDAVAYRPGEITKDLILESMQPGRHLSISMSGVFEPGTGLATDEEEQVLLDCISKLLERSALRLGYARVEDGVRLDFGGYILGEDGNLVYSDNAMTLNHDGIILETDLMEGRRLFVGWETIIEQLEPDNLDLGDLFLEMAEQDVTDWIGGWIEEHAAQILEASMPYVNISLNWILTLPFEQVEAVDENSIVPAMPGLMRVSISRADISHLVDALLDQLQKPEDKLHSWLTHIPMISDDMLDETIEDLRNITASETTDHPMILTFLLPSNELPFALAAEYEGDIRSFRFSLYGQESENDNTMLFTLRLFGSEKPDPEEGEETDSTFSVSADLSVKQDPTDELVISISLTAEAVVDDVPLFTLTQETANVAFTAESGQPGYRQTQTQTFSVYNGVSVGNEEVNGEWVRTEEGGESYLSHGSSDVKEDGESETITSIVDISWVIEPVEGGLFDAAFSEILSIPSHFIEAAGLNMLVFGDKYESMDEYLTTLYYDELSGEEISDLESELMSALRGKRNDILEVLPEQLVPYAVQIIGGQIPDDDHDQLSDQGYLDGFMEGYGVGYDDGYRAGLEAANKEGSGTIVDEFETTDSINDDTVD